MIKSFQLIPFFPFSSVPWLLTFTKPTHNCSSNYLLIHLLLCYQLHFFYLPTNHATLKSSLLQTLLRIANSFSSLYIRSNTFSPLALSLSLSHSILFILRRLSLVSINRQSSLLASIYLNSFRNCILPFHPLHLHLTHCHLFWRQGGGAVTLVKRERVTTSRLFSPSPEQTVER